MENESAPQKSQSANALDLTGDYLAEKSKLRKSFGRKEVLFFSICSVIGLDIIGVVAAAGQGGHGGHDEGEGKCAR